MYNKFILKNGIRVVTENIPHVKSVSIGIWIETGSRHEDQTNNGVSHFIEHMLFKGTKIRSAKEIAESIDNIGGQLNAFTSKECTCFYAKVLDNHLPIAIEVLCDMLFNSKFDDNDITKEKSVVIEEINMYEDSPEEIAHELLSKTLFDDHPLAYPILGKSEILKQLKQKEILDYLHKHYTPENIVISVAGNIDIKNTYKMLENKFGHWNSNKIEKEEQKLPLIKQRITSRLKSTEQLHLCLGMEGIPQGKSDLYSLLVLNNIFGGSMSSRLFQKIREDRGLVYSIYSYPSSYKDIGTYTIYAGLNPNQIGVVSKLINEELNFIKKNPLSETSINKAKEQLKGNYTLGLESTSSRMTSLGKSELLLGKIYSPKEILEKIDKVNVTSVANIVDRVFNNDKMNISYVGNIKEEEKTNNRLRSIFF
ncbi:MAG: insulinase family protein [Firmicutes bacterium]|nr:insulinase family protein [Bacillota bacterium]